MMERSETDRSYAEASMRALGRGIGEFFLGLVDSGMSREDALDVTIAYVEALASTTGKTETET